MSHPGFLVRIPVIPVFQYDPRITADGFRILTLKQSPKFEDELICELTTFLSRAKAVESGYTALSHCWGPEGQAPFVITINDTSFAVKDELAAALRYLRRTDEDRMLWIDAVRLNQHDEEEMTAQVSNMDKTYENAKDVIVWLGRPNDEEKSSLAVKMIDILGSQLGDRPLAEVPKILLDPRAIEEKPEVYAPALMKLLSRPWFSRLWVIQEICLAPSDTTIVCGHDEVSFWKLASLQIHPQILILFMQNYDFTRETGNWHQLLVSVQEPPIGLTHQYVVADRKGRKEYREIKSTLLSHLWNFRNRQCTKAIDRVYALLGIACDIKKDKLIPDYTKTDDEAFVNATKAIISAHGTLEVLSMCQGPEEETKRPSWAPNFGLEWKLRPTSSLTVYSHNAPYFTATGKSRVDATFPDGSGELVLYGHRIDIITDVGRAGSKSWQGGLVKSKRIVEEQSAASLSKYANVEDAFWRTLITNRNGQRKEATANVEGEQFKIWWANIFTDPATRPKQVEGAYIGYQSAWLQHYHFRNFFITESGYMGLGPLVTKLGDCVCLLPGSQVPFVLRQIDGNEGKYRVVGECYLHGVMDGELWEGLEWTVPRTMFRLV